jgi:hypothetical protein
VLKPSVECQKPKTATWDNTVVVGSIQDFHDWIQRARDNFRFLVTDVMIAGITLASGALLPFARE